MTFLHGSSLISDRQQLVDVAGTHSTTAQGTYGVSQGFILGPLLCLIYNNDMFATLSIKLLWYANDSSFLVVSYGMSLISDCLIDYKWYLHLVKTESILLGTGS
jgi:hypothetical protein